MLDHSDTITDRGDSGGRWTAHHLVPIGDGEVTRNMFRLLCDRYAKAKRIPTEQRAERPSVRPCPDCCDILGYCPIPVPVPKVRTIRRLRDYDPDAS